MYDHLITNFPQFDLGIPDQLRVDIWKQDFLSDVSAGSVPALSILWVMCDHTGGPPTPDAEQADNDLAIGRIVDVVSHSNVWSSSAIFIEEDDAQNGVDHIDGHRSPGYIISPYARQYRNADHTYYTQVNMTRTIEQILGLSPMNQFDLVASPMRTAFLDTTPAADHFKPWTHVLNQVPLDQGVTASAAIPTSNARVKALRTAWLKKKQVFAGKLTKPDSEDPDTVNHLNWYMSTGFTRPYPGESTVRPPSDFKKAPPRVTWTTKTRSNCDGPLPITGRGLFVHASNPTDLNPYCTDVKKIARPSSSISSRGIKTTGLKARFRKLAEPRDRPSVRDPIARMDQRCL